MSERVFRDIRDLAHLFSILDCGNLDAVDLEIYPTKDLTGVVCCFRCNDLFYWATADYEEFGPEHLDLIEEVMKLKTSFDDLYYCTSLVCARIRNQRPQKPFMSKLPEKWKVLFEELP